MAVQLTPYAPRRVALRGLTRKGGVALKVYTITMSGATVAPAMIESAMRHAFDYIANRRQSFGAAGVDWTQLPEHAIGSLIVHQGRGAVFAVLDLWVDENMLRRHGWVSPLSSSPQFESLAPSDIAMCVWNGCHSTRTQRMVAARADADRSE